MSFDSVPAFIQGGKLNKFSRQLSNPTRRANLLSFSFCKPQQQTPNLWEAQWSAEKWASGIQWSAEKWASGIFLGNTKGHYETDISARCWSVILPFVKPVALEIVFFPLSQTDLMSFRPGRSFLMPWHRSRGNEKSTPPKHFFYSERGVEWCLYTVINICFCLVISEIHGEPTAALYGFSIYWRFKKWCIGYE